MDFKLSEAGLGAVEERFEIEMNRVIENTLDPNTDPEKERTITIKFKFKPNKNDRKFCELTTSVESKLVPYLPLSSGITMGINSSTGEINARETVQRSLFDDTPYQVDPITEADEAAREQVKEGGRITPFKKQASGE